MDWATFWKIAISAVAFGAGGEIVRRYRDFKTKRALLPWDERNAGLWTDRRLILAEGAVVIPLVGLPFTAFVLLISADRPFEVAYGIMMLYAVICFLFVQGLQPKRPR